MQEPAALAPATAAVAAVPAATTDATPFVPNAGMTEALSTELAALLDERHKRNVRKRRRDALVVLILLFCICGGSSAWFIQSPARMQALREAVSDIRSIGDIGSIVAKYQVALAKVAVHSQQIDQSTNSMGVSTDQSGEKDPAFDTEMKQMMGGEGKTAGERDRQLQRKFGDMRK